MAASRTHTLQVLGAFAVIYIIWGSTFLALKFAVVSIPPLMLMSLRGLVAGGILLVWAKAQGQPWPTLRQWSRATIAGALLFLLNHGGLAWALSRGVPSGVSSVLVATIPLWIVIIEWLSGRSRRPPPRVVAGIALGFAGTALLVGPAGWQGGQRIDELGSIVLSLCAVSWASGSLYARHAGLPASVSLATGMQMFSGGSLLIIASGLIGEWSRVEPATFTVAAWSGLLYLIFVGSLLGFSAYMWLLHEVPPARVATYAYVNPVVAMFLGWLFANETVSRGTVVAVALSLVGVFLVVTAPLRRTR